MSGAIFHPILPILITGDGAHLVDTFRKPNSLEHGPNWPLPHLLQKLLQVAFFPPRGLTFSDGLDGRRVPHVLTSNLP